MKYLIGLLIILFASFADIFLYRTGIIPFQPSHFLIPLFLILCIFYYPIQEVLDIFKSHSFKFLLSISLISIIYSSISPASTEIIITDIVLNILTLLLYIFIVQFFRSVGSNFALLIIFLSFLVLSSSVWYDVFIGLPKFSKALEEMVRKGGFGENPNQAASAMKFLALCVLVFLKQSKVKRLILITAMVVSVFLTFSRSGIISVILIIIFGTANSWSPNFKISTPLLFKNIIKMAFLFVSLYFCLLLFAGVVKQNVPEFSRGAAGERLDLLLGQSKKSIISEDIGSGGGRGDLLFKYWDDFKRNPLGYGTGFSSDKKHNQLNTHNYYLFLAVNYGLIAFLFYIIYIIYGLNLSIKADQYYYLIFLILIIFEGLISHQGFINRSILISLALFDSLIYQNKITKEISPNK